MTRLIEAKVLAQDLTGSSKVISVVYHDDQKRRCTMFATAGTPNAAVELVALINDAVSQIKGA